MLAELPDEVKDKIFIYQDDVLVAADTAKEVETILQKVLTILKNNGAIINETKSFLQPKNTIEMLGYKVSHNKVAMAEDRIQLVKDS